MTTDMMRLQALLEKNSDTDFLREMIAFAAQRLMDLDVEGLAGAGHGERSADRLTSREKSVSSPRYFAVEKRTSGCRKHFPVGAAARLLMSRKTKCSKRTTLFSKYPFRP